MPFIHQSFMLYKKDNQPYTKALSIFIVALLQPHVRSPPASTALFFFFSVISLAPHTAAGHQPPSLTSFFSLLSPSPSPVFPTAIVPSHLFYLIFSCNRTPSAFLIQHSNFSIIMNTVAPTSNQLPLTIRLPSKISPNFFSKVSRLGLTSRALVGGISKVHAIKCSAASLGKVIIWKLITNSAYHL